MQIIVVRHGIAVDVGKENVWSDADRMLSEKGRKKTRAVAEGMRAMQVRPERIVSSPLIRARETADMMRDVLAPDLAVELFEALCPGARPERVFEHAQTLDCETCMLVGHMPDCADIIAAGIFGHPAGGIQFKKAGAACLHFPDTVRPSAGVLEWLLTPRILRGLA